MYNADSSVMSKMSVQKACYVAPSYDTIVRPIENPKNAQPRIKLKLLNSTKSLDGIVVIR